MSCSAFSNLRWITILSGNSGTNNGTISISFERNTGNYRVGTITISAPGAIGDGQTVEIRQSPFTNVDLFDGVPVNFVLSQNYPNPFNPSTRIHFGVPNENFISLKVYDVLGIEIASLVNQILPAGTYSINFEAGNLNNGIYFYRLQAGKFSMTKKMILVK